MRCRVAPQRDVPQPHNASGVNASTCDAPHLMRMTLYLAPLKVDGLFYVVYCMPRDRSHRVSVFVRRVCRALSAWCWCDVQSWASSRYRYISCWTVALPVPVPVAVMGRRRTTGRADRIHATTRTSSCQATRSSQTSYTAYSRESASHPSTHSPLKVESID